MTVTVVIPAYQAEAELPGVVRRLAAFVPPRCILVVDDGSRDRTAEVARGLGVQVVRHPENRGKGHALQTGFSASASADAVVTLDADGQHPPECLPAFLEAGRHADLVVGRRAREPHMPLARRFANWSASAWSSWLAGQRISDSQCGYRLYRRRVLQGVPARHGRYEFESQILVRASRLGYRLAEVDIPTVYGGAPSHIRPLRDVPRIAGVLCQLTWERFVPPAEMRRASRAGATS